MRENLPNRRPCETIAIRHNGAAVTASIGRYPDGRPAELFLNSGKIDSDLDCLMADAAVAISIALQHGAPVEALRHSMKKDPRGGAVSAIGVAITLLADTGNPAP